MSTRWIMVRGERYVSLRTVAESYGIERTWIVEVYSAGLLGVGVEGEDGPAIALEMMDRVAEVRRLHRYLGLDLEGVALWIAQRG